jgi:hypothetical protein
MLMIGIGEAGKNIAELFKPHTQNYKIITLDAGQGLDKKDTVEEYDEIDFKFKQRGLKSHTEAIVFVCGSGKVAGASLRVLEALRGYEITLCYIVPELEFCSKEEKLRNKVHYNVMQQYARSGMINEMMLLDNKTLLDIAGAGTVTNYYEKVNYFIYSTLQNIMYCAHVTPAFGKPHKRKDISRISTFSYGSFDASDEKMIYPLDNVTETCYYINIEEDDLNGDDTIIPKCKEIVRKNNDKGRETSFAIWESSEENHFYAKHYTHFIQDVIEPQ